MFSLMSCGLLHRFANVQPRSGRLQFAVLRFALSVIALVFAYQPAGLRFACASLFLGLVDAERQTHAENMMVNVYVAMYIDFICTHKFLSFVCASLVSSRVVARAKGRGGKVGVDMERPCRPCIRTVAAADRLGAFAMPMLGFCPPLSASEKGRVTLSEETRGAPLPTPIHPAPRPTPPPSFRTDPQLHIQPHSLNPTRRPPHHTLRAS